MAGPLLLVKGLKKQYGKLEALKGIDFEVYPGEVFALIGPNGAGKTTALRIVATILRPSEGQITVDGLDITKEADQVREIISYLPEEAGAYKNLTGEQYLRFIAELFFAEKQVMETQVKTAMEMTGLGSRLSSKTGTYSKGMTRKLLLSRALMTKPKLAILDEPTSGLDVLNALEIRKTVRSFAADKGMAVLLSSHNMLEIEYLSDRVAIVSEGVIHDMGAPGDLKDKYSANNLEEVFAEVTR